MTTDGMRNLLREGSKNAQSLDLATAGALVAERLRELWPGKRDEDIAHFALTLLGWRFARQGAGEWRQGRRRIAANLPLPAVLSLLAMWIEVDERNGRRS